LALEPALRDFPLRVNGERSAPRLPISSEDDTFTKLARASPQSTSRRPRAAHSEHCQPEGQQHQVWRGETHRTGDERVRRQDRLTVSLQAPKDSSQGVHVSRPSQQANPRGDLRAAATTHRSLARRQKIGPAPVKERPPPEGNEEGSRPTRSTVRRLAVRRLEGSRQNQNRGRLLL